MSIKQALQVYNRRSFKIQHISGERQFEHIRKLRSDTDINLNIIGCNEPVPAIEWFIKTIKERVRAIANQPPFETYPHRLIKYVSSLKIN